MLRINLNVDSIDVPRFILSVGAALAIAILSAGMTVVYVYDSYCDRRDEKYRENVR